MLFLSAMKSISSASHIFIRQKFLEGLVPSKNKTLFAMCGIPGAGKSTFVQESISNQYFSDKAFILNPDHVMKSLPEYQDDFEKYGAITAFENWEMPARYLAYSMLDDAIVKGVDIIIDMGCVREEDFKNILNCKKAGYKVRIHYIYCHLVEAERRIQERARHTPMEMLRERQAMLEELLPKYRMLADKFKTFDNSDLQNPFQETSQPFKKAL